MVRPKSQSFNSKCKYIIIQGGVSIVQDEGRQLELVELLKEHIGKLEAGNWEIVQIYRVGQQVVAGMKYFYYGTFSDRHENKIYASVVTLYIRPWDRFVEGKI